jgi:hypothetical protein
MNCFNKDCAHSPGISSQGRRPNPAKATKKESLSAFYIALPVCAFPKAPFSYESFRHDIPKPFSHLRLDRHIPT